MSEKKIDFGGYIPYYIQLMELLKDQLENGSLEPGDRLPSEPALGDLYGVSRTVVRQALRELELAGLIVRRKGRGTFVAEPKIEESLIQKLTGFYQDMVERGRSPITQVLRQEVIPAASNEANFLDIQIGMLVYCIERLRFIDEEPIVLVTTYIPYDLVPELENYDLKDQSLYAILEKDFGMVLARGKRFMEAVPATEREAKLLQTEVSAPLFLLDSVTYLDDGRPIEYYHAVHRGDRSRFEVELIRQPAPRDRK
jgi:GntR family transcriptional regulator